jgi:pilus assembly protein Flp/PilA
MFAHFSRLLRDENGVTMIEYGLMGALVAVVIIGAVTVVGTQLNSTFTTIGNSL